MTAEESAWLHARTDGQLRSLYRGAWDCSDLGNMVRYGSLLARRTGDAHLAAYCDCLRPAAFRRGYVGNIEPDKDAAWLDGWRAGVGGSPCPDDATAEWREGHAWGDRERLIEAEVTQASSR